jgi:energy-coupling factor transporter ATP-binding protein EcfA2
MFLPCIPVRIQVLVLDEVTSALDVESEVAIDAALKRLQGCTKLIIAHRLSTVRSADCIAVVVGGQVGDQGVPGVRFRHVVGTMGAASSAVYRVRPALCCGLHLLCAAGWEEQWGAAVPSLDAPALAAPPATYFSRHQLVHKSVSMHGRGRHAQVGYESNRRVLSQLAGNLSKLASDMLDLALRRPAGVQVVEQGTHEELVERDGGVYQRLVLAAEF